MLAKRQPAASYLRLVFGITKIVTDRERAGDEAKKIAMGVRRIYEAGQMPSQYGIALGNSRQWGVNLDRASKLRLSLIHI